MAEIDFITHYDSRSPVAEAYRAIRTNLQFSGAGKTLKTIVFTSAIPNEGKSMTVANLAITIGQDDKKILLIDCDMHKPVIHRRFSLLNRGLSNCFAEDLPLKEVIQADVFPNLDIVTSGPRVPPNPAELLGSKKMKALLQEAAEMYDYVFLDMPPVLAVTDAVLMSSQTDGTILVLGSGDISPDEGKQAKELLEKVHANILGVILNKVPQHHKSGYYYYYYYDENHNKKRKRR